MGPDTSTINQSIDEKLFSLLISTVSDYAIFMLDPRGYIMSWNKGAEHIKGYQENDIVGKHISVFYTPADIAKGEPEKNLKIALEHGRHEQDGWRVRKDGSVFWANVVFTPLYNDQKELLGFAKITRDITERKAAEDRSSEINSSLERRIAEKTREIIANEMRFRKLIENSYDGITLMDEQMNILYRSQSSERINGWKNNERALQSFADLTHPADFHRVTKCWKRVLNRPNEPQSVIFRAKHAGGYYIDLECVFVNRLHDTTINAVVCNFKDVTERIKAETEIKSKTEQIESILERIADGFITLDNNFRYTYANKKIGEMLKTDTQRLIGKSVWELFPDVVGTSTYHAFLKAQKEQRYVFNEDHYEPLGLWQENHIYPTESGLSVFIRDISERKQSELKIHALNESLEKKVVERTAQLQAANRDLESFSYSVSHDLRTPLRAINGYAAMLQEDFEPLLGAEGRRILNNILHNSKMMGQLIDDLLTFSRLGRKELVMHKVDMEALAKSCIKQLLQNQSLPVVFKTGSLPSCTGDATMLKQVWLNLISNAIKYSAKKENPKVEIGHHEKDGQIIYYVNDNGVGFDMTYSEKLFGVFQRLHRQEEFEGTGVGLALVKRIIDKHKGRIWADAAVGQGATFYFSLP